MDVDLHESRLATTDATGHRVFLHPEDVVGKFRTWRTRFYWFLIVIYMTVPWIHFQGRPLILLDIPRREFIFIGHIFHGHDTPLFFFLMAGWIFFVAALTGLLGRVWCGWACPQTVFIDAFYRKVEELIEGRARQRRALEDAPWTVSKTLKKILKWSIYLIVSLHIAHSFLGYFVGARNLLSISFQSPSQNWTLFLMMLFVTSVVLFDFGWFREQFCIIVCPYGRLQSILMDAASLVIGYDKKRGEPRRAPGLPASDEGDCISCSHCVKACPTGIDIRRGTQLECIACTACIDACDEIMVKVNKPTGLIRYASQNEFDGEPKPRWRPRVMIYFALCFLALAGLTYSLVYQTDLSMVFTRTKGTPYSVSGDIVTNQMLIHSYYRLDTPGTALVRSDNPNVEIIVPQKHIHLRQGKWSNIIFFRFPKNILKNGEAKINVEVYSEKENMDDLIRQEITLLGPQ
jgi:cytochrome c oxidase accessory protein FixG